eukprot:GDKK01002869.1.p1 GENE.GDKK01002869.1~~GDKK01002869.1.p1  ORF type:complete len:389 (-),score=-31.41 GDKK01002869.1:35-1201(-)
MGVVAISAPAPLLVVIGGADAFGLAYNDITAVEIGETSSRCTVIQGSSATCPFSARMGHSAFPISLDVAAKMWPTAEGETQSAQRLSQPIIIFGGMSMAPEMLHNSLWVLRIDLDFEKKIEDHKQKAIRTPSGLGPLTHWDELSGCSGAIPSPRHAHASTIVGDDLIVIGGSDDTHPLEDGFTFNLISRTWRPLELTISPSASNARLPAREMASMCVHPATGVIFLAGGRDGDGLMIGDGYSAKSVGDTLEKLYDCETHRRCCHTIVPSVHQKLGPVCLLVGGFTPAGMPQDDVVITTTSSGLRAITAPRKLLRKPADELHFGLGHSSATLACDGILRIFVVTGIIPNTVGSTLSVYELIVDGSDGPHAAAGSLDKGARAIECVQELL